MPHMATKTHLRTPPMSLVSRSLLNECHLTDQQMLLLNVWAVSTSKSLQKITKIIHHSILLLNRH